MANITQKRTGEFLREVCKFIWDKPNGLPAKDILGHIAETMALTDFEKGSYSSNASDTRYSKIIRFGTIGMVKAGWLIKAKGYWTLTELGKEAYNKHKEPEDFFKESSRLYQVWLKSKPKTLETTEINDSTGTDIFAIEQAEENAWKQIEDFILKMNPYEFQNLVADLLRAMDYHVSWISPPGKDKGIDIIAYNDPLGTNNPRIKVQVKHRENSTAVDGLRAFMATLGSDDVGIFVSSGGFTSDAKEEARTQERRKITLIDLEQLYDLWVQYYGKLSQDARQRFPLKPVYFLDLDD
jgi:restriction system protein